ncbi:winged helix DNA-binding protein [Novosphingobium sp. SL115]|uniref:winged helix DNA-binding protein n=1 Tax=Novosphingobium sp. SL115 TaxID=2995150 RepID=UPI0022762EF8|nr:winged helix DNA-binding protein [Novosphingobium sp. SL115]MCY1671546.1 winged helix DNA-binding protein [Novosphingobium sp. SL115]
MDRDQLKVRARRLIAAANELLTIAHELEQGEGDGTAERLAESMTNTVAAKDSPVWAELARNAYRERRRRADVFKDQTLFGEPAWDIMLDLFIAAKERKRLPVTSACIGAAVPATTALRWLTVLEEKGLIVRENDTADARRVFVRLSAEGYEKMVGYFAEVAGDMRSDEVVESPALRMAR